MTKRLEHKEEITINGKDYHLDITTSKNKDRKRVESLVIVGAIDFRHKGHLTLSFTRDDYRAYLALENRMIATDKNLSMVHNRSLARLDEVKAAIHAHYQK